MRSFAPEMLAELRAMPLVTALDRLGLYYKIDPSFIPRKIKSTRLVHVSVGGRVHELILTGPKWYDVRARRGGGGAIDLTMHLLGLSFVDAVKRLSS